MKKTVLNSNAEFEKLLKFLKDHDAMDAKCYLESTGSYSESVAEFLYDQKIAVTVVNSYKIVSFAKLKLSRIKTDKNGAKLIAEYGCISNDKPYQKLCENLKTIRALYRTYVKQTEMYSSCKNQIKHVTFDEDKKIWQKSLDDFEVRRKEIVNKIVKLINPDDKLKSQFEKLRTI